MNDDLDLILYMHLLLVWIPKLAKHLFSIQITSELLVITLIWQLSEQLVIIFLVLVCFVFVYRFHDFFFVFRFIGELFFKPNMNADELFEATSQALLNGVDRDSASGWGALVYVIEKDKVTVRELKGRQD